MPKFLIYSFCAHLIFFLIVKIDFKERSNLKGKSVSIEMVEKKLPPPAEKKAKQTKNISSITSKKVKKELVSLQKMAGKRGIVKKLLNIPVDSVEVEVSKSENNI